MITTQDMETKLAKACRQVMDSPSPETWKTLEVIALAAGFMGNVRWPEWWVPPPSKHLQKEDK